MTIKVLTGERLRRRQLTDLASENLMLRRCLDVMVNAGVAVRYEGPWALRLIDGYAVLARKGQMGVWVSTVREFIHKNITQIGDSQEAIQMSALARYAQEMEKKAAGT